MRTGPAELLSPLFGPLPTDAERTLTQLEEALRLARRERVVPLLAQLVAANQEADNKKFLDHLFEVELANMAYAVAVESRVLALAPLMEREGIGFSVLKGLAVAHLDYPGPHWRQFGDADLLVSPDDFAAVLEFLRDEGWENESEVPQLHLQFTHALPMRHPSGVIIDVHQTLGRRALGRLIPTEVLLDSSITFTVAGVELRALADPYRLAHACIHWGCSRGQFKRSSGAADVIVMSQGMAPYADELSRVLRSHKLETFVGHAIVEAHTIAGQPIPAEWERSLGLPAKPTRLVERAHLGPQRRPVLEELAFFEALHRSEWLPYLRGYLTLDAAYRDKHGRHTSGDQLRYLANKIRGRSNG